MPTEQQNLSGQQRGKTPQRNLFGKQSGKSLQQNNKICAEKDHNKNQKKSTVTKRKKKTVTTMFCCCCCLVRLGMFVCFCFEKLSTVLNQISLNNSKSHFTDQVLTIPNTHTHARTHARTHAHTHTHTQPSVNCGCSRQEVSCIFMLM